jgi:hypothetical protein
VCCRVHVTHRDRGSGLRIRRIVQRQQLPVTLCQSRFDRVERAQACSRLFQAGVRITE